MDEKIKTAFDSIHADDLLKEKTREAIRNKQRGALSRKRRAAAIAACLLIVLCGAGGFFSYTTPVAAISIDDDQSVELGINMFDKVVRVKQYGSDGDMSSWLEKIKHKDYTEAINSIMSYYQNAGDSDLADTAQITVACNSSKRMKRILEIIDAKTCVPQQNVYCMENIEDMKEAQKAGISTGKYRVYLELLKIYPKLTVEEIRDMNMKQLRQLAGWDSDNDNRNGSGTKGQNGSQNTNSGQNGKGSQSGNGKQNGSCNLNKISRQMMN